jgi:DNA-binding NarL/FixJ family response regulator
MNTNTNINTNPIRLLLADDHTVFVEGLRSLLESVPELTVVGEAFDGEEVVQRALELKPDVVLLDIGMPKQDGVEAAAHITNNDRNVRVIMLSMNNEPDFILRAVQAGASGYLLKNASKAEIVEAIKKVVAGKQHFSSDVALAMMQATLAVKAAPQHPQEEILTPREVAVARLLAQELTNAEVADRMNISIRTVEAHRMNILRKLNLKSVVGLAKYARDQGWVR